MGKKSFSISKITPKEDDGDTLLPIMSLLLILIVALISNLAFIHIKAISVSIPGISEETPPPESEKKTRNVMLKLEIENQHVGFTIIDEDLGQPIEAYEIEADENELAEVGTRLIVLKSQYQKLDTIMVHSADSVEYGRLAGIFDRAREPGSLGETPVKFNLVVIPKGAEDG